MINTVFVRAFSALCVSLCLTALLVFSTVHMVEQVRTHAYWEQQLGQTVVALFADVPDRVWSDSSFPLQSLPRSSLDRWFSYRLDHGGIVPTLNGHNLALLVAADQSDQFWRLDMGDSPDTIWSRLGQLIQIHWRQSGLSPDEYLQWLRRQLPFPITLAAADSADVLVFLNHPVVIREDQYRFMVPVQELYLVAGPTVVMDVLPWPAWALMALLTAGVLALVVFWLVSSMESGLRHLDQATGRLAAGHLSTRIAVSGDDPVSRLGYSFNKMAEHIQRLIGVQREMIRAVSHELRTPVARLRFGMQIIEDVTDDAYVHRQLKGMDSDIQELDQLIDEILTYARLEEGGPLLEFQQTSLVEIVYQVVEEARPPETVLVRYEGNKDLRTEEVELEPRYIHRAVQNLVGNACRYASSQVLVSCVIGHDTCRVDVEDDGPGIPEEHWGKIFQAFARLDDSRTRSSGGYGLGLSIVRRIAYWHGGRAIVGRSESLGGARFSLVWPRRHLD